MASTGSILSKHPVEGAILPQRKRLKTSDLPLTSAQRSSIDNLLHTIKKKGAFDALRKKVWSQFDESDAKTALTTSLTELAESEIDREPSLLSRDRGKAATLIEGAVDRSNIYKSVEASIDALLAEHISSVELAAREIRRQEVGDDVAAEEERLGSKTDEEYAQEAATRREIRRKTRMQEEAKRQREEVKNRLRIEEKQKMKELEQLRSAEERRKEEEAKEIKRKADREAKRELEKKLEEEREAEKKERYEKWKSEERERDREERERARDREERERDRERPRERLRESSRSREYAAPRRRGNDDVPWGGDENSRPRSQSRPQGNRTPPSEPAEAVDEKALEEAALELLLREGRELAAKSGTKVEIDRSESLEPPPRRGQAVKSRVPESSAFRSKEESRSPSKADMKSIRTSTMVIGSSTAQIDSFKASVRGEYRDRSLSPEASTRHHPSSSRHRSHSRSRSRTRYSARWDEEKRKTEAEAKEAWKRQAVRKREAEAEAWKRAAKEGKERPRSQSRSPSVTRHRAGESERDRTSHSRREPGRDYTSSHRRHHSRSRSPAPRSKYDRSRSPRQRKSYLDGPSGRSTRPKSPVDIDRYVPEGSSRARSRDGASSRRHHREERDRYAEREGHREERERDRERDRYTEREGHREERDRDRHRERGGHRDRERDPERERHRDRERNPERHRERDPDSNHRFVEIDRYVPGGGGGGGGGGEDDGKKRKMERGD